MSGETGYDEQGSLTKLAARDRAQLITDGDHQAPPQVPFGIPFLVIGNIRTR